ncbi:MAG: hypothetical protein SGJ17_13015 [Hyphomicrobiales bacterium]|nr:hypothetical protein [Hyphomicrobiales bacterium]
MDPDLVRQQLDEEADFRLSINGSSALLKRPRMIDTAPTKRSDAPAPIAGIETAIDPVVALSATPMALVASAEFIVPSIFSALLAAVFSVMAAIACYLTAITLGGSDIFTLYGGVAAAAALTLTIVLVAPPLAQRERLSALQAFLIAAACGGLAVGSFSLFYVYAPSLMGLNNPIELGKPLFWLDLGVATLFVFTIITFVANALLRRAARHNFAFRIVHS